MRQCFCTLEQLNLKLFVRWKLLEVCLQLNYRLKMSDDASVEWYANRIVHTLTRTQMLCLRIIIT